MKPPVLYVGGLSKRVFLATKYRDTGGGTFEVLEKVDVTDHFVSVALALDEDWWNAHTDAATGGA